MRKVGAIIRLSLSISPVHDTNGKLVGAATIARDFTRQKDAEDQVRAASRYARSLIEIGLDPLLTISPEGKITDVNEATVQVTGVFARP